MKQALLVLLFLLVSAVVQAQTCPGGCVGPSCTIDLSKQFKLCFDVAANEDGSLPASFKVYLDNTLLATIPRSTQTVGDTIEVPNLSATTTGAHTLEAASVTATGMEARKAISLNVVGTIPDTTAPSIPTNVQGSGASTSQINLTWNASSDNVAVVGYDVYRNSLKVGTTATTSFGDVGLVPATFYSYTIAARDAAQNLSLESSPISVSTLGDTIPPTPPSSLAASSITTTQLTLTWGASSDNIAVVGYKITRNSSQVATTSGLTFTDVALVPGTSYVYGVVASDAAGNTSSPATLVVSTQAIPPTCTSNGKPYSITIIVPSYTKQVSIAGGARGRVDLQFSNPLPITYVQVTLVAQVVGAVPSNGPGPVDLRDMGGLYFSVPRTLGTYNLFVTAQDSGGCRTSTTLARTITVVP